MLIVMVSFDLHYHMSYRGSLITVYYTSGFSTVQVM